MYGPRGVGGHTRHPESVKESDERCTGTVLPLVYVHHKPPRWRVSVETDDPAWHPLSRCELSVKMQVQVSSDLPHNRCPVTPLTPSVTCDLSQPAHLAIYNFTLSCLLSPSTLIVLFPSHYSQSRKSSLVTFMRTKINTFVQVALWCA